MEFLNSFFRTVVVLGVIVVVLLILPRSRAKIIDLGDHAIDWHPEKPGKFRP